MGLTGKFWAHQYYDVVPDIIVFGKKSQGIYLLSILHSIISFFQSPPTPPALHVIHTAGDETD
jgi:4-aminobutyrate aminotransferase-like enzyme